MHAEALSIVFAFDHEGGARRRRPGSRRSTSAWTVYVGADFPSFFQSASGVSYPGARIPRNGAGGPLLAWEPIQLPARAARRRSCINFDGNASASPASGYDARHLASAPRMSDRLPSLAAAAPASTTHRTTTIKESK